MKTMFQLILESFFHDDLMLFLDKWKSKMDMFEINGIAKRMPIYKG
jgi:hypothetical protein